MVATTNTTADKVKRLLKRPDFKTNPARAISRSLIWRLRWLVDHRPWLLKTADDFEIFTSDTGAGALIYYLGHSAAEIARFITQTLHAGMTFWDIGAHIGEFSLLAARCVAPTGHVEAFEPQPDLCQLIEQSARRNSLSNIRVHREAISDVAGSASLALEFEPSLAHLGSTGQRGAHGSIPISTITLDSFYASSGVAPDLIKPDLIKIDVEGAERLVLAGAKTLLDLPPAVAPVWIVEYLPHNCASFSYDARELLDTFLSRGYQTYWLRKDLTLPPTSSATAVADNFVATKRDLPC